uniref:Uncharacterized protein n=1 Tax=Glossina pallidipes TaxID=7398 RepID=A0A1B0A3T6_GLOPL
MPYERRTTTLKSKVLLRDLLRAKRKEAQKENTNSWQNSIYIKYKKYEKLHLKSWLMFSRFTDLATQRQYQHQVMLLPFPTLFDAFAREQFILGQPTANQFIRLVMGDYKMVRPISNITQ